MLKAMKMITWPNGAVSENSDMNARNIIINSLLSFMVVVFVGCYGI